MPGVNLVDQLKRDHDEQGQEQDGLELPKRSFFDAPIFDRFRRSPETEDVDDGYVKKRLLLMVIAAGIIFGARHYVIDELKNKIVVLETESTELTKKIEAEKKRSAELAEIRNEMIDFDRQVAQLRERLAAIRSVGKNRNLIVRMMDYLISEMPQRVWISDIELGRTTKVKMKGTAVTLQIVSEYIKRLQGAIFFPEWTLKKATGDSRRQAQKPVQGIEVPADVKDFELEAKVVEPTL